MGAAVGITLLTTVYGGTRQAGSFAQAHLASLGLPAAPAGATAAAGVA